MVKAIISECEKNSRIRLNNRSNLELPELCLNYLTQLFNAILRAGFLFLFPAEIESSSNNHDSKTK